MQWEYFYCDFYWRSAAQRNAVQRKALQWKTKQWKFHFKVCHRIKMEPQTDRLIRMPEIKQITGYSHTTIYGMIKEGSFPKQIRMGKKCSVWKLSEVTNWIASLSSEQ